MQAKTIKIIKVPLEGRKKLIEKYQCTSTTIYNALGYRTNGETPEAIRRDALTKYGGKVGEKIVFC